MRRYRCSFCLSERVFVSKYWGRREEGSLHRRLSIREVRLLLLLLFC